MKSLNIGVLLIFIFGLIGYSPYFDAIDQIGPQWLLLNVFNLILILFVLIKRPKASIIIEIFRQPVNLSFLFFILWGLGSYFYAINPNEVIVVFSILLNLFTSLILVYWIIKKYSINFLQISILMSIFLTIEVFFSMYQYIQLISIRPYDVSQTSFIRGVTGNKNITSASIAVKIPFLLFTLWQFKNRLSRFFLFFLLFISYYNLILLSSRAVYISLLALNTVLIIFCLIRKTPDKMIDFKQKILPVFGVFIFSLLFSFLILGKQNSASISNRIQTINYSDESTQQRLRYYGHAFEHFLNNPIIGTGLGNWKIKSVDYDSKNMNSYIVPYHVHNDFLEFASELGVIGLIFYLFSFFYVAINFLKTINKKTFFISLVISSSLLIYFIDSNLNFPSARVINILSFVIILSSFNSENR